MINWKRTLLTLQNLRNLSPPQHKAIINSRILEDPFSAAMKSLVVDGITTPGDREVAPLGSDRIISVSMSEQYLAL